MTGILRASGVRKRYGSLHVLRGLTIGLDEGEVLSIIGPNGAGKTTLLSALSCSIPIDAGEIHCAGHRIDGRKAHQVAKSGLIARTFQQTSILPDLSLSDNVLLGAYRFGQRSVLLDMIVGTASLKRRAESDLRTREEAALCRLGITECNEESPSAGHLRLLQIARAIAAEPQVLMLDEPTAGLDPDECAAVCRSITAIASGGTAVIVIEHDMEVVRNVADRVVVLSDGSIVASGRPSEVAKDSGARKAYEGQEAAWI